MKRKLFLTICIVLVWSVCAFALGSAPPPPPAYSGDPMFERYVAIGDSLTHGFQSGAVDETRQPKAYASLVAQKMGTDFNLPLLKFPGYLVNIEDVLKGNIAWWQYYYPLIGGKRVDGYDDQDTINNFGITGAAIHDCENTSGSAGGFYKLVLSPDGAPAMDQALSRNPTFVSFWLANNDVLGAALYCDPGKLTPIENFRADFQACAQRLEANCVENGGSIQGIVMVNVPDVTAIAYLKEIDEPGFPAGSMNPFWMIRPSDDLYLSPDDIAVIQQRAAQVNQEIEYTALANGWAFVDANAVFNEIALYGHDLKDSTGVPAGQIIITSDYLGGLFSLDGVHPSITGHAVAANYIIDAINMTFGKNLAPVDEIAAAQGDSLFQDPVDPRDYLDGWVADAIYFAVEIFM